MSNLKILGKDTAIYGFGNVLKKFIGLLLLPFYTRALSPGEYGLLDSLSTFSYFLSVIFACGLVGATGRYFFVAETDHEKSRVLSTALIISLVTNVLPIILILPFCGTISKILFDTEGYKWVVMLSLMAIPFSNISSLQEVLFRYYRKPWKYLTVSMVKSIATPLLGILLVVILHWGVFGATLSSLLSSIVVLLFAYFYYTKKKYVNEFSWYWAKKMLIYGYPLIFTGIMLWVNNVSDRFFLLHYSTLEQIGLYSIGNIFAQPILFINMALSMSGTVLVMALYSEEKEDEDKPKTKAFLTKIWYTYLAAGITLCLFISIFSYEIVKYVTTPAYIMGVLSIPFLMFSSILYQSSQITGNGMSIMEKSKPYFWSMLIAAGSNFLLNFYFVPHFGFIGAAFTTLISNIIYFLITYIWSQKVFYIKRNFILPTIYFFLALGISLFFPFAQLKFSIAISLWYKILAFTLSLALPFVLGLVDVEMVKNISRDFIKRLK